jgi:hypothetical protein
MRHQQAAGVKLEVRDDAAAQTLTVRLGPLNLPAHSHHTTVAQAPDQFLTIPFDGWLVAYHPRLVDERDNILPNRLLHHVGFWNTARSDFLCPNKQEHIFGAGGEMNDWPALAGYGYRVAKGSRIRVNTMFHNPTDNTYRKAYLEVKLEYRRAEPGSAPLKSVYPTWFDVQQCASSGYDLKPGRNVRTGEFTLGFSGTLLGAGGHLHDYGQRLVLWDAGQNQPVATLDAKLDPAGRILSMPVVTFTGRSGYRLNRGARIRVTATYDNRAGKLLPEGAMGIVVGYFLPDDDAWMAALVRRDAAPARPGGPARR